MANGFRFQFGLLNPELTVTRRRLTLNYRANVGLGSRGATKWDKMGQNGFFDFWDKMGQNGVPGGYPTVGSGVGR